MEVNNQQQSNKDITLPTGSQMFWTAIGISLYVYIWIVLINMQEDDWQTRSGLMSVYAAFSTAGMFIHYMEVNDNDRTNMLHMINPFFIIRWYMRKLITSIKKLNKYLDKIFD